MAREDVAERSEGFVLLEQRAEKVPIRLAGQHLGVVGADEVRRPKNSFPLIEFVVRCPYPVGSRAWLAVADRCDGSWIVVYDQLESGFAFLSSNQVKRLCRIVFPRLSGELMVCAEHFRARARDIYLAANGIEEALDCEWGVVHVEYRCPDGVEHVLCGMPLTWDPRTALGVMVKGQIDGEPEGFSDMWGKGLTKDPVDYGVPWFLESQFGSQVTMSEMKLSVLERGQVVVGGREINRIRARAEGEYPGFETVHRLGRLAFCHTAEGPGGKAGNFYYDDLPQGTTMDQVVEGFCAETGPDLRVTWMTVEHAGGRRHVLASLPEETDLLELEVWQSPEAGLPLRKVRCLVVHEKGRGDEIPSVGHAEQ